MVMLSVKEIAEAVRKAMSEATVTMNDYLWPVCKTYRVDSKPPHGNISVVLSVESGKRVATVHHGVYLVAVLKFPLQ